MQNEWQNKPQNANNKNVDNQNTGKSNIANPHKFTYKFTKKNFAILRLESITSLEQAKTLANIEAFAMASQLPKTTSEEFYLHQLKNFKIIEENGKENGILIEAHNFGAGDILEIKQNNGKIMMVSFNESYIKEIDLKAEKIYLCGKFSDNMN